MEYRNFDLLIESKENDRYPVKLRAPYDVEDTLCEGILSDEMTTILKELEQSVAEDVTPAGVVDVKQMKKFGGALYECLFRQNIRDVFNEVYGEVRNNDDLSLRIRLIIEPPEIAQLPWELMYDKRQDLFLCTFDKTSITRYPQVQSIPRDLTVKLPLRVLVAIPLNKKDDQTELNTAAERKRIESAFKRLTDSKLVELDFVDQPVTTFAINAKLDEKDYHIFHFIGHGCLENEEGHLLINRDESDGDDESLLSEFQKEGWIRAESFANLFTNSHSMKLVVLNSCSGAKISTTKPLAGMAPRLMLRNIPAVVAMQYPIFDDSALIFSTEFYRKLCSGHESGLLDPAVISARNMIYVKRDNGLDFATPVLLLRTSSGVIFDLKKNENHHESSPQPSIDLGETAVTVFAGKEVASLPFNFLRSIWRRMVTSIRTLDEAPRLQAVGEARTENIALLRKGKDLEPEAADRYDREIEREEQELVVIRRRLQAAASTSFRFTSVALALGLPMLLAAVFGVLRVFDDRLQQTFFSRAAMHAPWPSFSPSPSASPAVSPMPVPSAMDPVRVVVVDPADSRIPGFPNPGTPKDRAFHAKVINGLTDAGAKVVALDINFAGDNDADGILAAAIKRAYEKGTQVIVGVNDVNAQGLPRVEFPTQLQEVCKGRWGNTNVGLSYEIGPITRSGLNTVLRHIEVGKKITEGATPSPDGGIPIAPSLVLKALMQFGADSSSGPPTALFYEHEKPMRIRLSFPNGHTRDIPVADDEMSFMLTPASNDEIASRRSSYQDVYLNLGNPEKLALDYAGKIVLVGYGVEGDRHFISWKRQRYGVEIQANAIFNILQGVYAMKVPWRFNFWIFLLMVLLGYLLQSRYAQKLSISIGFDSPTLNRMLKIPVALILATLLYFVVIYFVYSNTVYVVDMTYHILTMFLAYWLFGLLKTRKKARAKEHRLVNAI